MFRSHLLALVMTLSVSTITNGGVSLHYGDIVYSQDGAGSGANNAVYVADPTTGNRTLISQPGVRGSGPDFGSLIGGIATDPNGQILLATFDAGELFRIDPRTGDRTIVSGGSTGTGPNIHNMNDVIVAPSGDIYVTAQNIQSVVKIDPITGNRTLVSGPGKGTGETMGAPFGLSFAQDGGLFAYDANNELAFHIDMLTGNRKVVSGGAVGSGPAFVDSPTFPGGFGNDIVQLNDGFLVTHQIRTIYRVDPVTGDRQIFSGHGAGSGAEAEFINFLTVAPNGDLIVSAASDGIFRVDPITGERTMITGDLVGIGPSLQGSYREAVVVTVAVVPEVSTLLLLGVAFVTGGLIRFRTKKI